MPRPNLSPLPQPALSGEKTKSTMGAAAFEQSLDELLNADQQKTEELPIFNTQAIEDALKGVLDEDGPR